MPSIKYGVLFVLGALHAAAATAISPNPASALYARQGALPPFCACTGGKYCGGTTPQCTIDNKGSTECCAAGQRAIDGKCVAGSANLCSDGKTICSGATSQCTINVSVYVDTTGGAVSNPVCCQPGQKALNGRCYAGNAKLMPCYQNGNQPCDWGQGYYCAWNAGNADSKCCRLDEYYKGTQCVRKP